MAEEWQYLDGLRVTRIHFPIEGIEDHFTIDDLVSAIAKHYSTTVRYDLNWADVIIREKYAKVSKFIEEQAFFTEYRLRNEDKIRVSVKG